MENPKGYIIYLPNHPYSVQWANEALASGRALGWNLELYPGIDGRTTTIAEHKLKFYTRSKKSLRLIERPGTLGCFLSQYSLWYKCLKEQKPICIFEHDVLFKKPFSLQDEFDDVLKFQGFTPAKKNVIGQWWEGARAYLLKPAGAVKLVQWVKQNGAIPADWALNASILDVKFDKGNQVSFSQKRFSFTKDLK